MKTEKHGEEGVLVGYMIFENIHDHTRTHESIKKTDTILSIGNHCDKMWLMVMMVMRVMKKRRAEKNDDDE